jgi:hypothetical protein
LGGNVLFTAPDREPIELSTTDAVVVESTDAEGTDGIVRTALLIGLVVTVVGAGIAGLVWAVTRRRRLGAGR